MNGYCGVFLQAILLHRQMARCSSLDRSFTRQNIAAELHTLNESCYIPKFPMLRASLFSDCLMGHAGSSAGNSVFMDMRTLSVGLVFFFFFNVIFIQFGFLGKAGLIK